MQPFVSEIRIFSFDFAPPGWAKADGQILRVSQNMMLFKLIGNRYGGDGVSTFALPDLRGRAPINTGRSIGMGQSGGEKTHTLLLNELPNHNHRLRGIDTGESASNSNNPADNLFSNSKPAHFYQSTAESLVALGPLTIGNAGSGESHPNMQPYLGLNFCICLQGIFPSQN